MYSAAGVACLSLAVCLVAVCPPVSAGVPAGGCNVDPILQYGIVEAMLVAEYIVYGQYDGLDAATGYGKFTVFCAIKRRGAEIPENITVRMSECQPTEMSADTAYVLLLRSHAVAGSLADNDRFQLDEASKDSSAAFPASANNLQLAVNLCGLDQRQIKEPLERVTETTITCPLRTAVGEDDCVTEDVASGGVQQNSGVAGMMMMMMMTMMMAALVLVAGGDAQ